MKKLISLFFLIPFFSFSQTNFDIITNDIDCDSLDRISITPFIASHISLNQNDNTTNSFLAYGLDFHSNLFQRLSLSSRILNVDGDHNIALKNYIDSIKNFYRVYSGINERSATEVEKFLKTIISTDKFPLTRLHSTEASEMAKVLENSYRAMNISFMVEWSRFAENSGVNIYEVIDAIRQRPTHANMMYPGIGVGGYCLTKDPLLASWASKKFFNLNTGLESSVKAVEINDQMPIFCFNFIEGVLKSIDKKIKNVGFLGVAYGPGIGDTRFSPVEKLYKLMSKEFNIFCSDPYVKYWQEMDISPYQNINDLLVHKLDCIIITTGHKDYIESDHIYKFLAQSEVNSIPIIDTVGLIDSSKLPNCYESGKNFFVLGTGN